MLAETQWAAIFTAAQKRGARWADLPDVEAFKREVEGALGQLPANPAIKGVTPNDTPAPGDAFPAALKELLKHEGGYVNHKADPGGRTNLGVTQRVWEAWTGKRANETVMRGLTVEKVAPLYRKHYWETVRADELPGGLALTVFDFGVNAGPGRAIKFLQQLAGVLVDGVIGPMTVAAAKKYVAKHGEAAAICAYSELRRQYYRSLRTYGTFGKGWLRRVKEVEAAAMRLAK
jgi:lysozyme family protein